MTAGKTATFEGIALDVGRDDKTIALSARYRRDIKLFGRRFS